jgi:hypothetical protein
VALASAGLVFVGSPGANGDASVPPPTKLLHGPLILRLTGQSQLSQGSGLKFWRYLMFFKLSRDPAQLPISYDRGPGQTPWGNYSVIGDSVFRESHFGPWDTGKHPCMFLQLDAVTGGTERLDAVHVGQPVKVKLRPLNLTADGGRVLGKTYTVRPRLRTADVLLRGKAARTQLRRIGCDKVVHPSNDR